MTMQISPEKLLSRIGLLVIGLAASPLALAAPGYEEHRLNAAIVLGLLGAIALGLGLRNLRELRYRPLHSLNNARAASEGANDELHSSDVL